MHQVVSVLMIHLQRKRRKKLCIFSIFSAQMIAVGFGRFLVLFLAEWASSQPEINSPCGVNWTQRCQMKGDLTPVLEARGLRISVRGVKIAMRAVCQPYDPTYTTELQSNSIEEGSASGHLLSSSPSTSTSTSTSTTKILQSSSLTASTTHSSELQSSSSPSMTSPSTTTLQSSLSSTAAATASPSTIQQPKGPPLKENQSSSNSKATINQPQGSPHKNYQSISKSKPKNKMAATLMIKSGLKTHTYNLKTGKWTVLTTKYDFGNLILDEKHQRVIFILRGSIGFATTELNDRLYQYVSGFGSYEKTAIDSEHELLFLVGPIKGKLGSRYLIRFNTSSAERNGKLKQVTCLDDDDPEEKTQMAINVNKRYLYIITNELVDEYTRKIYITTYSYSAEIVRRIPVKKKKILCLVYDSLGDRLMFTNKEYLYKVNLKTGTVSEINLVKYPTSTIKHLIYSYGTAILITWDRILFYDLDWKFKKEVKRKVIEIACLIPES